MGLQIYPEMPWATRDPALGTSKMPPLLRRIGGRTDRAWLRARVKGNLPLCGIPTWVPWVKTSSLRLTPVPLSMAAPDVPLWFNVLDWDVKSNLGFSVSLNSGQGSYCSYTLWMTQWPFNRKSCYYHVGSDFSKLIRFCLRVFFWS